MCTFRSLNCTKVLDKGQGKNIQRAVGEDRLSRGYSLCQIEVNLEEACIVLFGFPIAVFCVLDGGIICNLYYGIWAL